MNFKLPYCQDAFILFAYLLLCILLSKSFPRLWSRFVDRGCVCFWDIQSTSPGLCAFQKPRPMKLLDEAPWLPQEGAALQGPPSSSPAWTGSCGLERESLKTL